jgi:hypothetical protein
MSPSSSSDSVTTFELFAESMRHAMDKSYSVEMIFLVTIAVVLLVVVVVLYEIHRTNKASKESMYLAWKTFDYRAAHLKLGQDDIAILKEIVYESGLQDPSAIIKSPHLFETSLEKYYEEKKIESMPNGILEEIRELRKRLGFLPLSREIAFTSTRQFDIDERCIVQIPDSGKATHKGMCLIRQVEERYWYITRPDGPEVPAKTKIYINLTRAGDAEYIFRAQVLRDLDDELLLTHVNKLDRTQQRNWVRIDVNIPVEVTEISPSNGIGDIFAGKIVDMSGGGLGMTLPIKLRIGTKLLLYFELPGQHAISKLPVVVVRVSGFVHSVAFDGEVPSVQEQIIQYVFEKQRQNSQNRPL